jgi:hypothetical protein
MAITEVSGMGFNLPQDILEQVNFTFLMDKAYTDVIIFLFLVRHNFSSLQRLKCTLQKYWILKLSL